MTKDETETSILNETTEDHVDNQNRSILIVHYEKPWADRSAIALSESEDESEPNPTEIQNPFSDTHEQAKDIQDDSVLITHYEKPWAERSAVALTDSEEEISQAEHIDQSTCSSGTTEKSTNPGNENSCKTGNLGTTETEKDLNGKDSLVFDISKKCSRTRTKNRKKSVSDITRKCHKKKTRIHDGQLQSENGGCENAVPETSLLFQVKKILEREKKNRKRRSYSIGERFNSRNRYKSDIGPDTSQRGNRNKRRRHKNSRDQERHGSSTNEEKSGTKRSRRRQKSLKTIS